MTDALTIGGALSATKAAFDLTKAFVDVRDATKVQAVKFELMGLLLQAQEAEAALIAEKRQLEERVRALEAWDGEKQRYQLEAVGEGGFAYALKPEATGTEPPHKICAHCYEHGHKSLLMTFTYDVGRAEVLRCHQCASEIAIHGIPPSEQRRPAPTGGATWGRGRRGVARH